MPSPDLIDSAVTDAVAADAIFSGNRRRKSAFTPAGDDGHCSNCGTALKGPICHSCGQDADTFHRPVWSLVLEVLDGFFSFDGRFWRTIPALMFRPGRITRHYLSGVRARYVQPFRLFIVASLAFFLVFSFGDGDDSPSVFSAPPSAEDLDEADQSLAQAEEDNPEFADQIAAAREQIGRLEEDVRAEDEGATESDRVREQRRRDAMVLSMRQSILPEDYPDAGENRGSVEFADGESVNMNLNGLEGLPYPVRVYLADRIAQVIQEPGSWVAAVRVWTPRVIVALVPIYALLLALMHFWRRSIYFYDHLIVSLHFHSFLFFLMTALVLLVPLISGWAILVFFLWSNFYLYKLHRNIYEHGRFFALMRVLVLDVVYLFILVIALLIVFAFGVLFA